MTRRSRRWLIGLVVVVSAATSSAAIGWYVWMPAWRPSLEPGERFGIDVSAHQGEIDWDRVAGDDIGFAYIKATEGRDFSDRRFTTNWTAARAAGLEVGAYHYFTLCSDAAEQADHFLETVPSGPDDLPPVVDLEDLDGACDPSAVEVRSEVQRFVTEVERRTDRRIVLYVGEDFEARFGVKEELTRYLWERRLFRRPDVDGWLIWQAHWRARVDGIDGGVDLDVMRPADG